MHSYPLNMAITKTRRWMASLTAVMVLVASINCVCVSAISAKATVEPQAASHSCCPTRHHDGPSHQKPPQDQNSNCPHCHGMAAATIADKQSKVSSPDFSTSILTIDWHAPHLGTAPVGKTTPHNHSPPLAATTLLSLNCALIT